MQRDFVIQLGPTIKPRRTGEWVEVRDTMAHEAALELANGSYQEHILLGYESLSGSTLTGAKAKQWSGKYRRSRHTLLERLTRAGIPWCIETQNRRQILVFG